MFREVFCKRTMDNITRKLLPHLKRQLVEGPPPAHVLIIAVPPSSSLWQWHDNFTWIINDMTMWRCTSWQAQISSISLYAIFRPFPKETPVWTSPCGVHVVLVQILVLPLALQIFVESKSWSRPPAPSSCRWSSGRRCRRRRRGASSRCRSSGRLQPGQRDRGGGGVVVVVVVVTYPNTSLLL